MSASKNYAKLLAMLYASLTLIALALVANATSVYAGVLAALGLEHPYLLVETNTTSVGPSWTTISVKIVNIGGAAYDVEVFVAQPTGLEVKASRAYYPRIASNSSVVYVFKAKPIAPTQASVQLVVKYRDPVDNEYKVSVYQLFFAVKTGMVKLVASSIKTGMDEAVIRVYNLGDVDALNATISLVSWSGVEAEPISRSYSVIPAGGYVDLPVRIKPTLPPMQAPSQAVLTVQVEYYDPVLESKRVTLLTTQLGLSLTQPILTYHARQVRVDPGSCVKVLAARLYNIGDGKAYNISISYAAQPPLVLMNASPTYIDELSPGESVDIYVNLCVPLEASSTSSMITARVEYVDAYGVRGAYSLQIPVAIPQKRPKLMVLFVPSSIEVSEASCRLANLSIIVEGESPIYIQSILLQPVQGIVAQLVKSVQGMVEPGTRLEIPVRVCAPSQIAVDTTIPITARVAYRGPGGLGEAIATLIVRATRLPTPVFTASCTPSIIEPKASTITIRVSSNEELRWMHVKALAQQLGVYGENYAEETNTTVFNLTVAVPMQFEGQSIGLSITIEYEDAYGRRGVVNTGCSLVVAGRPLIEPVSITVAPKEAKPGDVIAVSVLVANRGTGQALDAIASIEVPKGFIVIGEKATFIGRLMEGQTTILSYTVEANSNVEPGEYNVTILLKYYDVLHREYVEEIKIPLKIIAENITGTIVAPKTSSEKTSKLWTIEVAAIGAILGIGIVAIAYYVKSSRAGGG